MTPFLCGTAAFFALVSLLALRGYQRCPANDLRIWTWGYVAGGFAVLAVGAGVAAWYGGTP